MVTSSVTSLLDVYHGKRNAVCRYFWPVGEFVQPLDWKFMRISKALVDIPFGATRQIR